MFDFSCAPPRKSCIYILYTLSTRRRRCFRRSTYDVMLYDDDDALCVLAHKENDDAVRRAFNVGYMLWERRSRFSIYSMLFSRSNIFGTPWVLGCDSAARVRVGVFVGMCVFSVVDRFVRRVDGGRALRADGDILPKDLRSSGAI